MAKNGVVAGDKRPKKELSPAARGYLIAYNAIQTVGWSYLLYKLITFYTSKSSGSLYEATKVPVIIFQNAAVLEVLHTIIKIVPSSPMITGMQVASRVIVVCGVILLTTAARETIGLPITLFAWSVTEIIRYSSYALNLLNAVPFFLTWLRYSTFIVLYIMGITGELLCVYAAQGEVGRTGVLSVQMPNRLNFLFSYQHLLIFYMLLYIPLFPKMYLHMFAQRRKVLGSPQTKKVK